MNQTLKGSINYQIQSFIWIQTIVIVLTQIPGIIAWPAVLRVREVTIHSWVYYFNKKSMINEFIK